MAAFHEVIFPEDISRGASGGPMLRTDIVELRSGFEERNAVWKHPRHEYNVGFGLRDLDDIFRVKEFFLTRQGRLIGFRFKDWSDWKSCDPNAVIGAVDQFQMTGDGAKTSFQLIKSYFSRTSGISPELVNNLPVNDYNREIKKPRQGTLVLSSVKVPMTQPQPGIFVPQGFGSVTTLQENVDYICDYTRGIIDLASAPIAAVQINNISEFTIIYAGFEFDVPVRFNTDKVNINVEVFQAGEVPDIPLLEVRS